MERFGGCLSEAVYVQCQHGSRQVATISKKSVETFKEYAQRWRELVAQLDPPLHDKEMVVMFIDTLQSPFYENMLGSVSSNFTDIVIIGERVELGMKSGKIVYGPSEVANPKRSNPERKDDEVQVTSNIPHYGSHALPMPNNLHQQGQNGKNNSIKARVRVQIRKRTLSNLLPFLLLTLEPLPSLLRKFLVAVCPLNPLQPPNPKSYDPNARCDYHDGGLVILQKDVWHLYTRCNP